MASVNASLRRFVWLRKTQHSSDARASEDAVLDFKHNTQADRASTTSLVSDDDLPLLPRPATTDQYSRTSVNVDAMSMIRI